MNRSFTAGGKTPVCHCVWGLAVWGGGVSPESIGIHRRRRHGQVKLKGGVPGRLACWGTADRQAACARNRCASRERARAPIGREGMATSRRGARAGGLSLRQVADTGAA